MSKNIENELGKAAQSQIVDAKGRPFAKDADDQIAKELLTQAAKRKDKAEKMEADREEKEMIRRITMRIMRQG